MNFIKTKHYLVLLVSIIFINSAYTQVNSNVEAPSNILEALSLKEVGMGIVTIKQPFYMKSWAGVGNEQSKPILFNDGSVVTTYGYRIQVYNRNLPKSKNEAYTRASQIQIKYPNIEYYISYKAPFWRLLVGDFQSKEDADYFLKQLIKELPAYKKEMYIVPSKIRLTH